MNSPLSKGSSYLALTNKNGKRTGWFIQQTGQKSWVASQFTNCITDSNGDYNVLLGNSIKCWEELTKRSDEEIVWRKFKENSGLRKAMFNILKYGKFESEEE